LPAAERVGDHDQVLRPGAELRQGDLLGGGVAGAGGQGLLAGREAVDERRLVRVVGREVGQVYVVHPRPVGGGRPLVGDRVRTGERGAQDGRLRGRRARHRQVGGRGGDGEGQGGDVVRQLRLGLLAEGVGDEVQEVRPRRQARDE